MHANGLQAALDSKATTTALTNGLATKQTTIGQGDLTTSQVYDLQHALDNKVTTTALNGKQEAIGDGDFTIARTHGLQAALDTKATKTVLTNGLATKQATIGQGDLTTS